MRIEPLSIVPFYGAKAKMSRLISDMLCTEGINVYIDAFGGSGKCTLNVPHYPEQIYNDSSAGMCCLIGLLTNEETGMELIRRLYNTEFSEDCFNQCMQFRNEYEDNYLQELIRQLSKLLRSIDKEHNTKLNRSLNRQLKAVYMQTGDIKSKPLKKSKIVRSILKSKKFKFRYDRIRLKNAMKSLSIPKDTREDIDYSLKMINRVVNNFYRFYGTGIVEEEVQTEIKSEVDRWVDWYCKKNKIGKEALQEKKHLKQVGNTMRFLREQYLKSKFFESACNMRIETMDIEQQYKLAVATFVVYQQSRDGAGIAWSKEKFHTTDDYHKRIDNLYECMKRLEGVKVQQIGALLFFLQSTEYVNRKDVMIYCDPTYLKDSTADDEDTDPLREYNPGMIYKHFWTRADHELFLQLIQNAKCKLLVSNYDDKEHLYDSYLSGGNWHRFDFETTTTMSNSEDNQRTECLWYNYEIE